MNALPSHEAFVAESLFGNWFLRTHTWRIHVLCRALDDLQRITPAPVTSGARILDVGCGFGHAFAELATRFRPRQIVGVDADPDISARAQACVRACAAPVELRNANAAALPFADAEFDVLFCHQTFHHIVAQEAALAEFFRVLAPGGMLLFAESTRKYIYSLPIRLLFRHPMEVQRTADEYVDMIRRAGFHLPVTNISTPYLWWSRPDFGLGELRGRPVPSKREETLINAVALKPPAHQVG